MPTQFCIYAELPWRGEGKLHPQGQETEIPQHIHPQARRFAGGGAKAATIYLQTAQGPFWRRTRVNRIVRRFAAQAAVLVKRPTTR